ncbi:hypothetical protein B0H63DRAFT_116026 [Podospora didyma]|uniref:Uncharacterized protein n=1 Tax=Podospora didyma TaxID=330526 RepID=A0AAE0NZI2_9PEZI|nr:hypothetical protein B0H63DRAFT_116026 [Podospora didyma]
MPTRRAFLPFFLFHWLNEQFSLRYRQLKSKTGHQAHRQNKTRTEPKQKERDKNNVHNMPLERDVQVNMVVDIPLRNVRTSSPTACQIEANMTEHVKCKSALFLLFL